MSTEFRPLNENEKAVILKAAKKGRLHMDDARVIDIDAAGVSYEKMQGGFCVCLLTIYHPSNATMTIYRGASRRSYKDPRKPIKGEMLAFSRAVLYSRPVVV